MGAYDASVGAADPEPFGGAMLDWFSVGITAGAIGIHWLYGGAQLKTDD